jgi:molybdate transport system substrate-binding protein
MPPMTRLVALGTVVAMITTGCGVAAGSDRITLSVLADSSLTDAFNELGTAYQDTHHDVTISFTFGGSQDMASEVSDPAPGDVLATADEQTMSGVAPYVTGRRAIAHTGLTIAVAPGDPKRIRNLSDLANPNLRVVLGGPQVPIGRYALQVLARAGVKVMPKFEDADSRTVLGRIRTDQADAAIVYITDMRSAGAAASSVAIPASQNILATYDAAATTRSRHPATAKAFVTWLGSPLAVSILTKYGFTTP